MNYRRSKKKLGGGSFRAFFYLLSAEELRTKGAVPGCGKGASPAAVEIVKWECPTI